MAVQPPIEDRESSLSGQMSFLDHLEELRTRILRSLIAVAIAFVVCYAFVDQLYAIVSLPVLEALGEESLVFTRLQDPFMLLLKVAFVASLLLSSPFLLAQLWLFIAPGLYKRERRFALPFILSATILGACGVAFAYFIAFPFAAEFLVQMGRGAGLTPMLDASQYFSLFLTIMVALAITFQIPPVIFVLTRMGVVTPAFLFRNTPYAVLIAFIAAAVITPTGDAPNMMIIAGPMILLYLVGVGVGWLFGKREPKEPKDRK